MVIAAQEEKRVREKGDWTSHAASGYAGKIERVQVSRREKWDVAYFIDHWLESRGADISNLNRDKVADVLERYDGTAPYERHELSDYLDEHFKRLRQPPARS